MNSKLFRLFSTLLLTLAISAAAHATLFDRSNGMIYDSDRDSTWLQDANYARTSGYDSDGLCKVYGAAVILNIDLD